MILDIFSCEPCRGLGWYANPVKCDWPITCVFCGGQGKFELNMLARFIDEDPRRLENVIAMRARASTALRVFEKLVEKWPTNIQPGWEF